MRENLEIYGIHLDVHQISTINTRWKVKNAVKNEKNEESKQKSNHKRH
jgi:hypothetical protein